MNTTLRRILCISAMICLAATGALGQTGAKSDGDWSDPSIWTGGAVPGAGDDVHIGSDDFPAGAAPTATVALSADKSAANVYLGFGAGTNGTLDLGNHNLAVGGTLYLGYGGGVGTVVRGAGSLSANSLVVDSGNTFTFGVNDSAYDLILYDSQVATAAAGNITHNIDLYYGSKLTLGANASLLGNLMADMGTATLDMQHHSLSADLIQIGWSGNGLVTIENRGQLRANYLHVGNQTFDFIPSDAVLTYVLWNGASATAATGNITANVLLYSGSKLTLGADMSLAGGFWADDGTAQTLDMGGHSLSAESINFAGYSGGTVTLQNRGPLSAERLYVGSHAFDFIAADSVKDLYLERGAHATTAATSNLTGSIHLFEGSKLTLGADVSLTDDNYLQADDGTALSLDMRGHTMRIPAIVLGYFEGGATTIENRGTIVATDLVVGGQTFDFIAADSVADYYLRNGASTTAATSNIGGEVYLTGGSKLTLGADLSLSGDLWAREHSIVDAVRHSISARTIRLGHTDSPASLVNGGAVYADELHIGYGGAAAFRAEGTIQNAISLSGGSVLTFSQSMGDSTGLTFNGTSAGSLAINDTSKMVLDLGDNDQPSWIFRWKDPDGGTWEGLLASLIGDGKISVTAPHGYQVYDLGGYTYLGNPVPVPATLVGLLQLGGIAAAVIVWRRHRRGEA